MHAKRHITGEVPLPDGKEYGHFKSFVSGSENFQKKYCIVTCMVGCKTAATDLGKFDQNRSKIYIAILLFNDFFLVFLILTDFGQISGFTNNEKGTPLPNFYAFLLIFFEKTCKNLPKLQFSH